ncbi:MAG: 6-phosphofructokinase, partial [Synergistaceae bacterium]|nr:6-phosphofructokinase [Synergistaceae bacterium]
LLDEGVSGVTVVKVYDGRIRYIPTTEAIVPRPVSLADVAFYEQMDVCFGRAAQAYEAMLERQQGDVERFM